jgi:hypothetical protein
MTLLTSETPFNFIHIGKCGGSTISAELHARNYHFEHYHLKRPIADPEGQYIVVVRDPLTRFVSAFNWRKHLYLTRKLPQNKHNSPTVELRSRAEREFLFLFENANALAEHLGAESHQGINATASMMRLIGHISQGFQWHLDSLLNKIRPDQISGVICMERLPMDFEYLFGFQPSLQLNCRQTTDETFLSEQGRANLALEFHSEFVTLEKLSSLISRAGIPMSMRYDPVSGAVAN